MKRGSRDKRHRLEDLHPFEYVVNVAMVPVTPDSTSNDKTIYQQITTDETKRIEGSRSFYNETIMNYMSLQIRLVDGFSNDIFMVH